MYVFNSHKKYSQNKKRYDIHDSDYKIVTCGDFKTISLKEKLDEILNNNNKEYTNEFIEKLKLFKMQ